MTLHRLNADRQTVEDTPPNRRSDHSSCRARLRGPDRRDRGGARPCVVACPVADICGCPPLPFPARLAQGRVLRSPARVDGLASRLRRLGGRPVAVQRRDAVPRVDVAVRGRHGGCVAVVGARAGVSGVRGVAARRRLMGGVGISWRVRAEVTVC